MQATFRSLTVDIEQWTGNNDDAITAHLGTGDWRHIAGTATLPGWWLYLDGDGSVCAMSDAMKRSRTT